MAFSNVNRTKEAETVTTQSFDVLVIGGGITGVGIALDAVSRGMSVCLCEMQDFAAGTSSRSTKLVHGGLRYLKQFEVKMVSDVGKEREIVYENGPHVTTPEWMLLPFYEGGTFGPLSTSIGLRVYDFLAGVKKEERRMMLNSQKVLEKEPMLKTKGLRGGGYYVEYRTDDARLTIEVAKKAAEFGAVLQNYMKVTGLTYQDGRANGATAEDMLTGSTYQIKARKVVNASGPWVDKIREKDHSKKGKTLMLTKGVHVVFDQSHFPLKQAIYFDTEDGRMMFAIPRDGKTYVGTSDTFYENDPVHPTVEEEDRQYIIDAINNTFPDTHITMDDIESSWAGVRPLINEGGKGPSEISRKDEIWVSKSGLITIAGGKLTGYRKMAEMVVDLIAKQFRNEKYKLFGECVTKNLPISGGEVGGSGNFPGFVQLHVSKGEELDLTEAESRHLVHLYGGNVPKVFRLLMQHQETIRVNEMEPLLFAKLAYAIEEEKVSTPLDFFYRRTGALLFDIQSVLKWKDKVIRYMAEIFGWSEKETNLYTEQLEQAVLEASGLNESTHAKSK
ncbi:MAG: glycerol-3-phosphate dehydrogenase/oxidase [Bacillus sp. (in: firmicutes)]